MMTRIIAAALVVLTACDSEQHTERNIQVTAPSDTSCAGVARLSVEITELVGDSSALQSFPMDPGKTACDFSLVDFELRPVSAASERRVRVEGRDSAGQVVVFGESEPFTEPAKEGDLDVVISVSRRLGERTAYFAVPSDWDLSGRDWIDVSGIRINLASPDAQALDPDLRRFAVAGLAVQKNISVSAWIADDTAASSRCTLGHVYDGDPFVRPYPPDCEPEDCTYPSNGCEIVK